MTFDAYWKSQEGVFEFRPEFLTASQAHEEDGSHPLWKTIHDHLLEANTPKRTKVPKGGKAPKPSEDELQRRRALSQKKRQESELRKRTGTALAALGRSFAGKSAPPASLAKPRIQVWLSEIIPKYRLTRLVHEAEGMNVYASSSSSSSASHPSDLPGKKHSTASQSTQGYRGVFKVRQEIVWHIPVGNLIYANDLLEYNQSDVKRKGTPLERKFYMYYTSGKPVLGRRGWNKAHLKAIYESFERTGAYDTSAGNILVYIDTTDSHEEVRRRLLSDDWQHYDIIVMVGNHRSKSMKKAHDDHPDRTGLARIPSEVIPLCLWLFCLGLWCSSLSV